MEESLLEVQAAIRMKGDWLEMVREANEDVVLLANEEASAESVIVRDPLGVVAVLAPWNVSSLVPSFSHHSMIHHVFPHGICSLSKMKLL